ERAADRPGGLGAPRGHRVTRMDRPGVRRFLVAVALALAVAAGPLLGAGAPPAAAADDRALPLTVTLTGVNPALTNKNDVLVVRGTLVNGSKETVRKP